MVKRVFYIEKEKFLRSMFELALRAKKTEIYTVESLKDNFYLIDDLHPDIIIFDQETCKDLEPEEIEKLLTYSTSTHIVQTCEPNSNSFVDSRIKSFFPKPIVAHNLAERILSLVD